MSQPTRGITAAEDASRWERRITPEYRAEAAILGAILVDEARAPEARTRVLDAVARRLSPAAFGQAYHQEVYRAILQCRKRGTAATSMEVREQLGRTSEMPRRIAMDGVRVAELLEAAPPRDNAVPTVCAAVVDAAIHREVHTLGAWLGRAATQDPETRADAVTTAEARLRDLDAQWQAIPDNVRTVMDAAPPPVEDPHAELHAIRQELAELGRTVAAAPVTIGGWLADVLTRLAGIVDALAAASAASNVRAHGGQINLRPGEGLATPRSEAHVSQEADELTYAGVTQPEQDPAARDDEQRLLGSLIADPKQLDTLTLTGDELSPTGRAVLTAMREAHAAGLPVDETAICWQAQRHGADPEQLGDAIRREIPGAAEGLAARITERDQANGLARAAGTLRRRGSDPRVSPGHLLTEACRQIDRLRGKNHTREKTACNEAATTAEVQAPARDRHPGRRPREHTRGRVRADAGTEAGR